MNFLKVIEEICQEENITFNKMSHYYLLALTKNNVTKYIWGYKFPLNDHSMGSIIDDKYALYCICKKNNIPVIEHEILWTPNSKLGINSYVNLQKYFTKFNNNVVIKPNNGSEGMGVSHLTNFNDLEKECDKLWLKNYSISITPFYNIEHEYRVIILDNEVKLIYEKNKPVVIGDGKSTLKELLLKLNKNYFSKQDIENENYVLSKDKEYVYDWHFNLSKGSTAKMVEDKKLKENLINMALNMVKVLNARFVSVDIISSNNNLYILEVNSGVCINKVCNFIDKDYKIMKSIYKEAIQKMFE